MGKWLQKYGYTIYGTRGGPFKPADWGVSTRKGNKIWIHILKWSGNSNEIVLPEIGMEIIKCTMADGGKVKFSRKNGSYILEFERRQLRPINTIIEIEVSGKAMDIKPVDFGSQSVN